MDDAAITTKDRMRIALYAMQRIAKQRAANVGHQLRHWGVDDPENLLTTRISVCFDCGRIAAIDMSEEPYLFGRAYTEPCPVIR